LLSIIDNISAFIAILVENNEKWRYHGKK